MRRFLTPSFGIKALVTALILYLVLSHVDLSTVAGIFERIRLPYFLAALILIMPMGFTAALRWSAVAKACGGKLHFRQALFYCWMGQFLGMGVPVLGFDGSRAWKLHRDGTPLGLAARSVVYDRIFALTSLVIVIALGMPRLLSTTGEGWFRSAAVVALLAAISALGILIAFRKLAPYLPNLRLLRPLFKLSEELNVLMRKRQARVALLWAVINHLVRVLIVFALALALGLHVQLLDVFALAPVALLMAMIPISLGGWGVREFVFMGALGSIGIAPAEAVSLSILFGLVAALTGFAGGIIWIFERTDRRRSGPDAVQAPSSSVTKPL